MGRPRQHAFQRVLLAKCYDQLMVAFVIKVIQTMLQVGLMRHCIRSYDEVQLNLLHDEFRKLK
eukprot:5923402-Karenia_brevis.AAC.1